MATEYCAPELTWLNALCTAKTPEYWLYDVSILKYDPSANRNFNIIARITIASGEVKGTYIHSERHVLGFRAWRSSLRSVSESHTGMFFEIPVFS